MKPESKYNFQILYIITDIQEPNFTYRNQYLTYNNNKVITFHLLSSFK